MSKLIRSSTAPNTIILDMSRACRDDEVAAEMRKHQLRPMTEQQAHRDIRALAGEFPKYRLVFFGNERPGNSEAGFPGIPYFANRRWGVDENWTHRPEHNRWDEKDRFVFVR